MSVSDQQTRPLVAVEVPRREGYVLKIGLHEPDEWNPACYVDLRLWSVWAPQQQNWKRQGVGSPTRKGVTVGMDQLIAVRDALDHMIAEAIARGMLSTDEVGA